MAALYKEPTLLDSRVHVGLRIKSHADWSFTRDLNAVFVTGVEFPEASREYAIAFVPGGNDANGKATVVPVALLGLRERQNLYLKDGGGWDARYMPAFFRRYPFAYAPTAEQRMALVFDASWAGFSREEGTELMTADGQATDYLKGIMKFLEDFEQEAARTRLLCEKLVEYDLLRGAEINGQLANGEKVTATGFFMVDEDRLRKLSDERVVELHRNGILPLLHAHLLSMGLVNRLAERLAALPVPAAA
ncbi:MAG: hypothetical protein RL722_170 [Pseudomonadota bacterium]